MKKSRVLKLLVLINTVKGFYSVEEILSLDERILEILIDADLDFDNFLDIAIREPNKELCFKKLEIMKSLKEKNCLRGSTKYYKFSLNELNLLNNTKVSKVEFVEDILLSKELKDAGLTQKAIKLIEESSYERFATDVLTNPDCIQAGIALEGAMLINESLDEKKAGIASSVITDSNCIQAGFALEAARKLNTIDNYYNSSYASSVLRNSNCIEAGIAQEGADIIYECETDYNTYFVYTALTNPNFIINGIALEAANVMKDFKFPIAAKITNWYLCNNYSEPNVISEAKRLGEILDLRERDKEIICDDAFWFSDHVEEGLFKYVKTLGAKDIDVNALIRQKPKM